MDKVIYILSYFIFSFHISEGVEGQMVKEITIHYINRQIDTQHAISCRDFDSYKGKGSFMTKHLINESQIKLFMQSLSDYKIPTLVKRIDVRAKAYIHYSSGKISIVCIDRFGDIMVDGNFIGVSSSLLLFLKTNCDTF
jgi:hypothetical protein